LTLLVAAHPLAHVNASLNALSTVLLVVGFIYIKCGRINAHKWTMLSAFAVSIVFLACYVAYHIQVGSVRFTHPGVVRYIYLTILASHVVLAAAVPFLAIRQTYLGFRAIGCCDTSLPEPEKMARSALYREKHMRLAKWTLPIWLYVSITGVVVYVMLYHLWPPTG
jgi:uncharacterized membrane protein YozB (DUF420 family)